jgi:hypothetical protein
MLEQQLMTFSLNRALRAKHLFIHESHLYSLQTVEETLRSQFIFILDEIYDHFIGGNPQDKIQSW